MAQSSLSHHSTVGRVNHLHFVGIGGTGMCGIAEVFFNLGYEVSGSDLGDTAVTRRLASLGIKVHQGHEAHYIQHADVVVCSTAIDHKNPEIIAAHKALIPVLPRAEMLAELMRFRSGIAVAGTHGKTTTTSLIASVLAEGGLDPTFVIGGRLNSAGSNARLGEGKYLVAEADESDASFLHLCPLVSVVTNIDRDHMETYDNDFNKLRQTYLDFLHKLPFDGLAVLCVDDPVIRELLPQVARPIITYGYSEDADVRATGQSQEGMHNRFVVHRKNGSQPLSITTNMPGHHNVLNTLATIAVATAVGVSDEAIKAALEGFQGVGRRFQMHGEVTFKHGRATLVEDYGHHPREIEAVVQAARSVWPEKRIVMVYQPHRYTRTQALFPEFVEALNKVDQLILMDVYKAGETPIPGADSDALHKALKHKGNTTTLLEKNHEKVIPTLNEVVKEGDVLFIQGAGDIYTLIPTLGNCYKDHIEFKLSSPTTHHKQH